MQSVIVEMEADFEVTYNAGDSEIVDVQPTLDGVSDSERFNPTLVRITGGAAEALLDVELNNIKIENMDGTDSIKLYDFDIIANGSGEAAIIIPDASEQSFLLTVGGKVSGLDSDDFYAGFNILNINYL